MEQAWTKSTKTTSWLPSDFPCSYVRGCICTKKHKNKKKWMVGRQTFYIFWFWEGLSFREFSMGYFMGVSKNRDISQNGWWKLMEWFRGTTIFGNTQMDDWKMILLLGIAYFQGLLLLVSGRIKGPTLFFGFQEISWLHRGTATEHELRGGLRRFSRCGFDGRHVGQVVHGLAGEKSLGLWGIGWGGWFWCDWNEIN